MSDFAAKADTPHHEPHGGRNRICLDMAFPIRGAGPEEPFNKPEGKEGEQERPLEPGWRGPESTAETRTHRKEANERSKEMRGGGKKGGNVGARLRAGKIRNNTAIGCVPAVCQALTEHYLI